MAHSLPMHLLKCGCSGRVQRHWLGLAAFWCRAPTYRRFCIHLHQPSDISGQCEQSCLRYHNADVPSFEAYFRAHNIHERHSCVPAADVLSHYENRKYCQSTGKVQVQVLQNLRVCRRWQTETGAHMITPLPGVFPAKPGSATLPFFGVAPAMVNEHVSPSCFPPSPVSLMTGMR